ncbi:MAG: CpsB/CapC family capsule biosynthesis tyrosine phosphatase [Candidatus Latescibacterota bacterium]
MIDIHAHVLPAVDDGAASMEEALQMLWRGAAEGIRVAVLTPHLRPEHGPEQVQLHRRVFAGLQAEAQERGLPITLHLGAEVAFRFDMEGAAGWGGVCLGDSRSVLVDAPLEGAPLGLEQGCFRLRAAGFRPVLAHPERLRFLASRPDTLVRLRAQGALVQVDAGSLAGRLGRHAQAAAERLVALGCVDVVASDAHDVGSRPFSLLEAARRLEVVGGAGTARRLLVTNPGRLLEDQGIEEPPAPQAARRRGGPLRRLLAYVGRG